MITFAQIAAASKTNLGSVLWLTDLVYTNILTFGAKSKQQVIYQE